MSSKTSFRPVRSALPRRSAQVSRAVTCSAQGNESSRPVQSVVAAAALAAAISFGSVDAARADISGLTPCAESKQFAKRQKTEVKTLQRRLKNVRVPSVSAKDAQHALSHPCVSAHITSLLLQYEPDSAPALALNATIDRTEKRFATYAKQGLLCGPDGLPHLIADPGLAIRYGHAGETLVSVAAGDALCSSVPKMIQVLLSKAYLALQKSCVQSVQAQPFILSHVLQSCQLLLQSSKRSI